MKPADNVIPFPRKRVEPIEQPTGEPQSDDGLSPRARQTLLAWGYAPPPLESFTDEDPQGAA